MKIWFDTEFIEDGKTIDLISIGMVREDGAKYYHQCFECDLTKASPWVQENVLPNLDRRFQTRAVIAEEIKTFAGENPEFWAYYADYDWVALCQLFGTMMNLPKGWPMYCRDLKQLCDMLGNPKLPEQKSAEHNALADAEWCADSWKWLVVRQQSLEARGLR